ncbi:tRNA (guanosine(18)-2'-O)-methyltransferase [Aquipluma nitroreducens]|uniref:tRNA (Guanosine(18)-2'-O)-methyltransferase n=1 Tax=Aquipluma nitroreducens TaxID=2010828 RepID=A0A5K7SCI0_9BACT|nr:RNA methyltransferase [Aquipluma nitroreducens]BBE19278.1 tRNA (guanosine(18)-2'-O)-methyltransferase [Aquipluma nitroreducens]
MLSKNKIKLIQSLNRKKDRDESGLFLVEGNKMVEEALRSEYQIETLVCTSQFADQHPEIRLKAKEIIETDKDSLQKASLLQNPQEALAIIIQPEIETPELNLNAELCLALDFIQDPGNLGTILRIADWFGITTVICSENTVDVFNPKVVQASMGAIFRIKTGYINLESFLSKASKSQIPVYGTFMDGNNIYTESLTRNGIVILGNEGNGISDSISRLVNRRIAIPTFSTNPNKAESLNVAIAASICCSEFRRR